MQPSTVSSWPALSHGRSDLLRLECCRLPLLAASKLSRIGTQCECFGDSPYCRSLARGPRFSRRPLKIGLQAALFESSALVPADGLYGDGAGLLLWYARPGLVSRDHFPKGRPVVVVSGIGDLSTDLKSPFLMPGFAQPF